MILVFAPSYELFCRFMRAEFPYFTPNHRYFQFVGPDNPLGKIAGCERGMTYFDLGSTPEMQDAAKVRQLRRINFAEV